MLRILQIFIQESEWMEMDPQYLLSRISDRVLDVSRRMEVAVDIGSGRGWVTREYY